MRSHIKALLHQNLFHGLQLLIIEESERGNVARVPQNIARRVLEPDEQPPRDSIIDMPGKCGQQLIDQLWQMGYRPSVGISSTGQDEAQKAHINDLRSVLFSLLAVERKRKQNVTTDYRLSVLHKGGWAMTVNSINTARELVNEIGPSAVCYAYRRRSGQTLYAVFTDNLKCDLEDSLDVVSFMALTDDLTHEEIVHIFDLLDKEDLTPLSFTQS